MRQRPRANDQALWETLAGQLTTDPVVGSNADGRLEVFARGADNALWHMWQTAPNSGWSDWDSLGGGWPAAVSRWAAMPMAGWRVFVQETDNALWHNVQSGSQWSGWDFLGGELTYNAVVARNADGRLEVFVRGEDEELWHNWFVPEWNGPIRHRSGSTLAVIRVRAFWLTSAAAGRRCGKRPGPGKTTRARGGVRPSGWVARDVRRMPFRLIRL